MYRKILNVERLACWILCIAAAAPYCFARENGNRSEQRMWPNYRHDGTLAGIFPASKGLDQAPVERWNSDLGGPNTALETVQFDDFNGDGHKELLRILPDRLICQTLDGDKLWEVGGLKKPSIIDVRDYAGDQSRGLFISSANTSGTGQSFFMINGHSGKKNPLFESQNVFGGSQRYGHLLPDVKGEQICYWWSGGRLNHSQAFGHGYLWSFEKGLDHPVERFKAEMEGVVYAPAHIIADMDLDGRPDMVMASHEQCWIWDLASGKQKSYTKWDPEIRTYQANGGAVPLHPGERPALLYINPNMPGVQVLVQEGNSIKRLWKKVVGPLENQYQLKVSIARGAPDPFLDLDGDGTPEMLTLIGNEHEDGLKYLVVFNSLNGERLFEKPDLKVLSSEDLDGDKKPEVFLQDGDDLRIAHWDGHDFKDLWRAKGVEPFYIPAPAEGDLTRSRASYITEANPRIWREQPESNNFLLKFTDGVWICKLQPDGSIEKIKLATGHEALATPKFEPGFSWDGTDLKKDHDGQQVVKYTLPRKRDYLAVPPLAGILDGERRVIVCNGSGDLVSYSADGSSSRTLIRKYPGLPSGYYTEFPILCDLDGDGVNELVASTGDMGTEAGGGAGIVAVDGMGKIKFKIPAGPGVTEMNLACTGRLGPGKPNWLAIRSHRDFEPYIVSVYDGKSGECFWKRDAFGIYGGEPSKFMLHTPASVFDYNGDGSDDMLSFAENFYGIISIPDNKDLVSSMTRITASVPGHWGAYATPMVVNILKQPRPQVFFSRAYALTLLTDLEGNPIWHYGLTPDTSARAHPGFPDFEGNGKRVTVTSRMDGLLTAYNSDPANEKCPTCPTTSTLEKNHAASIRWKYQLSAPVSDITTVDLDGDGRDELLCGGGHNLYALKETGGQCKILWSVDLKEEVGGPILADLKENGETTILVTTRDGRLHCLSRVK